MSTFSRTTQRLETEENNQPRGRDGQTANPNNGREYGCADSYRELSDRAWFKYCESRHLSVGLRYSKNPKVKLFSLLLPESV